MCIRDSPVAVGAGSSRPRRSARRPAAQPPPLSPQRRAPLPEPESGGHQAQRALGIPQARPALHQVPP
eukprot:10597083-Alexandrium_andersonii.AAC.1